MARGGPLGGPDAGAFTVIVGEDDDAHDLGWERDVGEIAGRERRPDRQSGTGLYDAERGLDALGKPQHAVFADLRTARRTAPLAIGPSIIRGLGRSAFAAPSGAR